MINTLLFIVIGVLIGLITGLLPAFHPNNVIVIILFNLSFFLEIFGLHNLIAFIVALSISHNCEASPFRAGSKFPFLAILIEAFKSLSMTRPQLGQWNNL